MKSVSIAIGAGQHGLQMISTLAEARLLKQTFRVFPELRVEYYDKSGKVDENSSRSFEIFERAVWSGWCRLPYLSRYKTPLAVTHPVADKILARNIESCDLFIGWTQISLNSIRRARDQGSFTSLEYPMANVSEWMELVSREYEEWGSGKGYHSMFPAALIARMEAECEEADSVNVLSTFAKESFTRRGFSPEKITLTPLGVSTDSFPAKDVYKDKGPLRLIYVGRLELLKGIQYLLQALTRIQSDSVELLLVGAQLPEISRTIERFADQRIKLVGMIPHGDLPACYRSCDVFVFPTVNDSFGVAVLEAMSSGLPVIVTENSCGSDVVSDGVDGFVVPIRRPDIIQEKIEYFLTNRQQVSIMGKNAREKVLGNFTLAHYQTRLIEHCHKLLERKK